MTEVKHGWQELFSKNGFKPIAKKDWPLPGCAACEVLREALKRAKAELAELKWPRVKG